VKAEYGPGYEVHHLPLPSGRYAAVRVLTNYRPVQIEMGELTGIRIDDLPALASNLLALQRQLQHPEGLMTGPPAREAAGVTVVREGRQ
jgi:hypothetical protein